MNKNGNEQSKMYLKQVHIEEHDFVYLILFCITVHAISIEQIFSASSFIPTDYNMAWHSNVNRMFALNKKSTCSNILIIIRYTNLVPRVIPHCKITLHLFNAK